MAKTKEGETDYQYELVPMKHFKELEAEVQDIHKSPFVSGPNVEKTGAVLTSLNESVISLLEILQKVSDETAFESMENKIIKKETAPLVKSIEEVKTQNIEIIHNMRNIMDRLNDIQFQVNTLQNSTLPQPTNIANPNLPPLQGGPTPPQFEDTSQPMGEMPFTGEPMGMPPQINEQPMQAPQMPGLNPKPLEGNAIPPPMKK